MASSKTKAVSLIILRGVNCQRRVAILKTAGDDRQSAFNLLSACLIKSNDHVRHATGSTAACGMALGALTAALATQKSRREPGSNV
jgi:hypothetical protein